LMRSAIRMQADGHAQCAWQGWAELSAKPAASRSKPWAGLRKHIAHGAPNRRDIVVKAGIKPV